LGHRTRSVAASGISGCGPHANDGPINRIVAKESENLRAPNERVRT
jgi:hypothetical protein